MSEETQRTEEKAKSIDAELLRQQAEEIRQSGPILTEESPGPRSQWTQAVYLGILVLVIGSVLFLLVFPGSRLRLLEGISRGWNKVSTQESAEIFKLPPPPPKAVEPTVVLQGSPKFVFQPAPSASSRASAESGESQPDTSAAAEESQPPAPPEKTAGSQAAYDLLVKNSAVVQKLTSNGFPDLQFKEWKPLRNSPPDFWIDIVADRAGQNVEFVWAVNAESGTVKALSQNARDLERR